MKNPDLVIVVNQEAFVIKGSEYIERSDAIKKAIEDFEELQADIDRMRDELNPTWKGQEITTIHVYRLF